MSKNELYRSWHKCCPACGSDQLEETTGGYIILGDAAAHEDENRAICKCGWRGIVHDLVAAKRFQSYSQASQDRFAHELIGDTGVFLDVGSNHPTIISNTWGLEELGWTGVLVENDPAFIPLLRSERTSRLIAQDARKIDWKAELQIPVMDYLSLDVDAASEVVLARLMENGPRFNVLTVEHDCYVHGEQRKINMLAQLRFHGYDILCADVCHDGFSFEAWAVDTAFAMRKLTRETLDKFTCKEPKEGKDFWK